MQKRGGSPEKKRTRNAVLAVVAAGALGWAGCHAKSSDEAQPNTQGSPTATTNTAHHAEGVTPQPQGQPNPKRGEIICHSTTAKHGGRMTLKAIIDAGTVPSNTSMQYSVDYVSRTTDDVNNDVVATLQIDGLQDKPVKSIETALVHDGKSIPCDYQPHSF